MGPLWEKIVSFSLLDATLGFSTPTEKVPLHTPQKNIFKPMEDSATRFQNFYIPLLEKQDKIFLFYVSGLFFFQIYEGNSYLLSENLPSARISIQVSTNQNALDTTSPR